MIFTNEATPAARLITVRVWAKREADSSRECFGYLMCEVRDGECGLIPRLRLHKHDRDILDALPEAERESLYAEAWRIYNVKENTRG